MESKNSQQYLDVGSDGLGVHQSILPTEMTDGDAGFAGSTDHLGVGENSMFDKGLIEIA
jgi:hypothetical protein